MNAKKLIGQCTDRLVMNVLFDLLSLVQRRGVLITPHKYIDTLPLRSCLINQVRYLQKNGCTTERINALFVQSIHEVLRRKEKAEFDAKKKH